MFLLTESRLVIQSSRKQYKVYTWGGCRTEDDSPALKLQDACLLFLFLPEESSAATRSDQDVNKWPDLHLLLGSPCDTADDLDQRALNWRSPKTEAGRSAPQWRARSLWKTRSSSQASKRTLVFPFSSLRSHVQSMTWLHFTDYPKSSHLTISTAGTLV